MKWISVKDCLPDPYSWVIASLSSPDDDWVEMVGYSDGGWDLPGRGITTYVTHWMPLPKPVTNSTRYV